MNPNNSQTNEDGMARGTLIASIVFSVIIVVIISFFLYLLGKTQRDLEADYKREFHNHQEVSAYRFTWIKNQLNQMQDICKDKDNRIEQRDNFIKRNIAKEPPVELLSKGGDCIVAKEVPEEQKNQTEEK